MPQTFNDILRVLGHAQSESFIRPGAARLSTSSGLARRSTTSTR